MLLDDGHSDQLNTLLKTMARFHKYSWHNVCLLLHSRDARGAPAKAIQELAGHADLTMTQRYMHLSPAALDAAIGLLDRSGADQKFGNLGETCRSE